MSSSCKRAPENLIDAQTTAIALAVEHRVDEYIDATRRHELNWFLGFWANADEFLIAGDGNLLDHVTFEHQLRKAVKDSTELVEMQFFNRHTYVLAHDAAVHTTQFRWVVRQLSGDTIRMHGSWSYVFKNFNGVWKVVHSAGAHLSG